MAEEEEDICAVCLDTFESPLELPCKHNFCLECVKMLKQSDSQGVFVICPLCEKRSSLGKDGSLMNLRINTTIVARGKLTGSARTMDDEEKEALKKLEGSCKSVPPRNIKLLEEFDASIGKDGKTFVPLVHTGMVGYGVDEDLAPVASQAYMDLVKWQGMIIGPQESPIGAMLYMVKIDIPDTYPRDPPIVRMTGPKVALPCVEEDGFVNVDLIRRADVSKIGAEGMVKEGTGDVFSWSPDKNIADVLVALRENLHIEEACRASARVASGHYT